ncbi:hypothetical protein C0992_005570, partial [Termitomyces sp. T32_za158]
MAPRTFTSAPSAKAANRRSAVYIGPGVAVPIPIPDLPGPPSSGSSGSSSSSQGSASASGLPSPPATNSTGSGGDSDVKEKEEERAPPPSSLVRGHRLSSSVSSVGSVSVSSVVVPKGASILEETMPLVEGDEDGDGDGDGEEDTARVDTLQRVKSLKDRNRLVGGGFNFFFLLTYLWEQVLDKLVRSGARTHSPSPSPAPSTSSSSYSQSPLSAHSRPPSTLASSPHNDPRSGSETERESTYSRASSSSTHHHHRAFSLATSTPQHEQLRARPHTQAQAHTQAQTHRSSVPSSPSSRSRASGSGSSSRRRMRLALLEDGTARLRERAEEILDRTKRESPAGAGATKRRAALPVEFRK